MSVRITDDLCDRTPENDPRGSQAAEVLLRLVSFVWASPHQGQEMFISYSVNSFKLDHLSAGT